MRTSLHRLFRSGRSHTKNARLTKKEGTNSRLKMFSLSHYLLAVYLNFMLFCKHLFTFYPLPTQVIRGTFLPLQASHRRGQGRVCD